MLKRYFPFIIVFLGTMYGSLDPDLGWHLKYGEYFFFHHHLLLKNTFSTEMPDYIYINSAWGTDLLTYLVFHYSGFLGISILGALVLTLTFYFFSKASNLSAWEQAFLFPLLIYFLYPITSNSFRGHYFSLLGIGILFYIVQRYEKERGKIILLVLPLFLIWVNLHGQFIMGLALFVVWSIFYLLRLYFFPQKDRKETTLLARSLLYGSVFGAGLVVLLNPFGASIYTETFRHLHNLLGIVIVEWSPPDKYSVLWWRLVVWGVFLFVNVIILFFQKKLTRNIFYLVSCAILYYLSFESRRYMWPLFLVSILIVSIMFKKMNVFNSYVASIITIFLLFCSYFYFGFIELPKKNIFNMNWNRYCYLNGCSPRSAEFLINLKPGGKLLSDYNWGGWLIWNYPQIKPSIDGRMAFWEDKKGNIALAKYYILENNIKDVDKSKYDIVYTPSTKPIFNRLLVLVKQKKWKLLYQDGFAFIFVRS